MPPLCVIVSLSIGDTMWLFKVLLFEVYLDAMFITYAFVTFTYTLGVGYDYMALVSNGSFFFFVLFFFLSHRFLNTICHMYGTKFFFPMTELRINKHITNLMPKCISTIYIEVLQIIHYMWLQHLHNIC